MRNFEIPLTEIIREKIPISADNLHGIQQFGSFRESLQSQPVELTSTGISGPIESLSGTPR